MSVYHDAKGIQSCGLYEPNVFSPRPGTPEFYGTCDKEHGMNIFVGNIAFTASEDDIRQIFEQHGMVDVVHLITDRYTGRSRGFGFVEMPNSDEAKTAITALNGADLHNRPLTVNEARPREPRRDGRREF